MKGITIMTRTLDAGNVYTNGSQAVNVIVGTKSSMLFHHMITSSDLPNDELTTVMCRAMLTAYEVYTQNTAAKPLEVNCRIAIVAWKKLPGSHPSAEWTRSIDKHMKMDEMVELVPTSHRIQFTLEYIKVFCHDEFV